MRPLTLAPALLSLAACSLIEDGDTGETAPDEPPDCDMLRCPDAQHPFRFDGGPNRVAAGTAISVRYATDTSLDEFRIVSDDPSVLEVVAVTDVIELAARAPGRATLFAEPADGSATLDHLTIHVLEVAAVEFWVRTPPITPEPVDRVAGLLRSSDSLAVVYLAGDGDQLSGRGAFSASGSVEIRPPDAAGGQLSDALFVGDRVGLGFVAAGPGTVSIDLAGRSFSLPIDVVRSVRSIEIATFVLGVTADWTVDPAVELLGGPGPATEIVFMVKHAGSFDVTAQHDSLSASRRITTE